MGSISDDQGAVVRVHYKLVKENKSSGRSKACILGGELLADAQRRNISDNSFTRWARVGGRWGYRHCNHDLLHHERHTLLIELQHFCGRTWYSACERQSLGCLYSSLLWRFLSRKRYRPGRLFPLCPADQSNIGKVKQYTSLWSFVSSNSSGCVFLDHART